MMRHTLLTFQKKIFRVQFMKLTARKMLRLSSGHFQKLLDLQAQGAVMLSFRKIYVERLRAAKKFC